MSSLRLICCLFSLAFIAWQTAAHRSDENSPEGLYRRGKEYFRSSVEAFQKLQQLAPGSAYALALRGDDLAKKHRYSEALDAYRGALARIPKLRGLHADMADIYTTEGNLAAAGEERNLEEKQGSLDCAAEKLPCDFAAGRFEDVLKEPGAKEDPKTLYWFARAYYELALASFAELDKLPESSELHQAKARLFEDERKYRESSEEWRAALKLSPANRELQRQLARALYFTQDYRTILPALQELAQAQPDSANLNFFAGDSFFEIGQSEQAAPYLEAALRLDPNLIPAHIALGICYVRLDKSAQAIPHLKAGLELDKSGRLYYLLARAYTKTGQPQLAKAMLDEYQRRQQAASIAK